MHVMRPVRHKNQANQVNLTNTLCKALSRNELGPRLEVKELPSGVTKNVPVHVGRGEAG